MWGLITTEGRRERYAAPLCAATRVFLELETSQEERLRRNETEFRLAEKPFKRDLEASRRQLLEIDAGYQLNSRGVFDGRPDWLRIDNTVLSAVDVAERVIAHFGLSRSESVR